MAALITVADDANFNSWADFGTANFAMERDASVTGLSDLRNSMAGFDQPLAPPPELINLRFAQQPDAGYADYLAQQGAGMAGYWAQPVAKTPDIAAAPVAALDALGDMFGASAQAPAQAPSPQEEGITMGALGALGAAFGKAAEKPADPIAAYAARRQGHNLS